MKTIDYKWLMLEFNIYKPSVVASLSVSAGAWWLDLSLSFVFFYLKIDVDKDNIEINKLREERKARLINKLKQE